VPDHGAAARSAKGATLDTFSCPQCGQLVFFANTACVRCTTSLGFDPELLDMVEVADEWRRCANRALAKCNWLVPADSPAGWLCVSCELTRTRPADHDHAALLQFAKAEGAKRRLVFQLRSLGVPLRPRDPVTGEGVAFDLLASTVGPVTTGHAGGIITLDLAESDDVHRERIRLMLSEPYRTVLGHFRHEIGHYLFTVLVADDADRADARVLFGDERTDYPAALERHYRDGAPEGWEADHVSEYATMHPAEDFAETMAHYLHIRGVLQSAAAFRLRVDGPDPDAPRLAADPTAVDLDDPDGIEAMIATWLPLSYALNAVNRSMGEDDLYPFVLTGPVIDKLGFVHRLVRRAGERSIAAAAAVPGGPPPT
jgi:hypothetical protein